MLARSCYSRVSVSDLLSVKSRRCVS